MLGAKLGHNKSTQDMAAGYGSGWLILREERKQRGIGRV